MPSVFAPTTWTFKVRHRKSLRPFVRECSRMEAHWVGGNGAATRICTTNGGVLYEQADAFAQATAYLELATELASDIGDGLVRFIHRWDLGHGDTP